MSYHSFSDVFRYCYLNVIKYHYFDWQGRARRSEYWFFMLLMSIPMSFLYGLTMFSFMINLVRLSSADYSALSSADLAASASFPLLALISLILMILWNLFHLLPSFGVTFRRLHDTGRSGWYLLINLIPLLGGFIFLYYLCLDSQPGENRYGPNPKEAPAGGG